MDKLIENIANDIMRNRRDQLESAGDVQWYVAEEDLDEGTADAVYAHIVSTLGF